jgi:dGTPase
MPTDSSDTDENSDRRIETDEDLALNESSIHGLQTVFAREQRILAPYATFSRVSQGRRHPESDHPYRGPFQRDRDRVIHSAAFRRLSGKMQVFTGEMGDYHRTRLTHTHEVASIARTIARSLQLNEDLVESLALLHDIGHPPFGHAGEDALDECLSHDGGFSHNAFALTLVETLEHPYSEFPGLNLTHEVLEGQRVRANKSAPATPRLEVQVVDLADSISYDAADIDDAVKLGLVELDELCSVKIIEDLFAVVKSGHEPTSADSQRRALVHELIDWRVSQLLKSVGSVLESRQFSSAQDICDSGFRLEVPVEIREQVDALESFLYDQVYRHPKLIAVRNQAQQRLCALFDFFCQQPGAMPSRHQQRMENVGIERAVVEYLAGMTDRYCDQCFQEHLV